MSVQMFNMSVLFGVTSGRHKKYFTSRDISQIAQVVLIDPCIMCLDFNTHSCFCSRFHHQDKGLTVMKRNLKLHAQNVSSRNGLLVNIIHFFVNSKTIIWT